MEVMEVDGGEWVMEVMEVDGGEWLMEVMEVIEVDGGDGGYGGGWR